MARVLFVIKKRSAYSSEDGYYGDRNTGLYSAANFLSNMLSYSGVLSHVVEVTDNNDIDRYVHQLCPTHVIIEAYWVVPEKFTILHKLHPVVQWIVRDHSEVPFLAQEGSAVRWTKEYARQPNVHLAANSARAARDLQTIVGSTGATPDVLWLPNYYPAVREPTRDWFGPTLQIGCFGAVRPLKNMLIQALAAMQFAEKNYAQLQFHINAAPEQNGQPNLKNLRALFAGTPHLLVEHPWLDRRAYLNLLRSMNVEMVVSFTETFCIVAADAVSCGVPLVCSDQVPWACQASVVSSTDTGSIVRGLGRVLGPWSKLIVQRNQMNLARYAEASRRCWLSFFRNVK